MVTSFKMREEETLRTLLLYMFEGNVKDPFYFSTDFLIMSEKDYGNLAEIHSTLKVNQINSLFGVNFMLKVYKNETEYKWLLMLGK